jgi:hypothetical protein
MSSLILRVMILCSTDCGASSVGAATSTKTGAPSVPSRHMLSSTRQERIWCLEEQPGGLIFLAV